MAQRRPARIRRPLSLAAVSGPSQGPGASTRPTRPPVPETRTRRAGASERLSPKFRNYPKRTSAWTPLMCSTLLVVLW